MDQKLKTSFVSESLITDFVSSMENRGLSRETIQDLLLKAIEEVENEVIEELMEKLSDDKKTLLDALVSQEASGQEIAKQLEIDEDELVEMEVEKFTSLMGDLTKQLR